MVKEGSASGADEDGNDGDEEQEAGDEVCHFFDPSSISVEL